MGRSEGLVLQKTNEFIKEKLEERRQLIQQAEAAGLVVDPRLKG
jgi:hypothetical protein